MIVDAGRIAQPRSVLVVLPTWVGDFVMATPTLRAIRERFAGARITFLMEPNLRDLISGGDWMDECIEWPGSNGSATNSEKRPASNLELVRMLRSRRFDVAILLANSFRSALFARLSGAKRRIGYSREGRGWLLTDRVAVKNRVHGSFTPMPLVDYLADLAESFGCNRPGHQLELFTTPQCERSVDERLASLGIEKHRPLVVLSPGAKFGAAKCWPAERFAAVADRLAAQHEAAIVVTCGPGEEPIAQAIGLAAKSSPIILDDPRLGLGELKSLIRRSDLLICNDAGPRHIAKAFGVAVVTVFGPTHPQWTATDYAKERIVRIDVDCGPCQKRVCPLGHLDCMTGVTVDDVFSASVSLLDASHQPLELARHECGCG